MWFQAAAAEASRLRRVAVVASGVSCRAGRVCVKTQVCARKCCDREDVGDRCGVVARTTVTRGTKSATGRTLPLAPSRAEWWWGCGAERLKTRQPPMTAPIGGVWGRGGALAAAARRPARGEALDVGICSLTGCRGARALFG
ncbi:Protein of unknown function [Gryllus bimaculatus]|nr:Protein of unknown function [Gryllus bimaculatus]